MTSQERPAPDGDLSQPKGDLSPPGNYLSVQEYARRTGISEKSVRRYLRDGRLTKHQPGGFNCRVTIPPSALAAPQTGDSSVPPSLSGEPDQPKAPAGKPVPKAATKRPLPKNSDQPPAYIAIGDRAVEMWKLGKSYREIGRECGCSDATAEKAIRHWHVSRGLPVPTVETRRQQQLALADQLHREGLTWEEIAERIGVSTATLRSWRERPAA